ncbi:MAG: hypothetical protein JW976_14240 [Syntrophaceae bacterium]|nr:hypothetical protein [Syntrophaceae bacterium]
MEQKEIMKQMIDVQKKSFDNFFSTIVLYQSQTEKLFKTFVESMPGMGDEGRKAVEQWSDAFKKTIDDLKRAVNNGYTRIEVLLDLSAAMFMYQHQTEKMLNTFAIRKNFMPQNYFMDAMREWIKVYNKNMKSVEDFFPMFNKQTNTKQKK